MSTRKLIALALVLPASAVPAAAIASTGGAEPEPVAPVKFDRPLKVGSRGDAVEHVQSQLAQKVTGRFSSVTERAVRRFQRRRDLAVDGVVGPKTGKALGMRWSAPKGSGKVAVGSRSERRLLNRIAECESGGNPRAVSPNGRYRGKYQFMRATWRRLGGDGDPARAAERTQDRIALKLLRREGTRPWPVCGSATQ